MTNPNFDDEDEKPLDPVMERVRRKMIRLQVISAGMIVVSLMAVLVAVVYKATGKGAQNAMEAATLVIPEGAVLALKAQVATGFRLENASLDGNRVLLTGTDGSGAPILQIFDMAVGRIIATIALEAK